MMNILNLTFKQKENVLVFPFNHENLLIPAPDNLADLSSIFAVNETGLIFWNELMSGKTANQICAQWSAQTGIQMTDLQHIALNLLSILMPILEDINQKI